MTSPDPAKFAKRVIELHGGHERFFALMEQRFNEFNAVWEQDAGRIGRVLRVHLAVEHFLTEYLAFANPKLGSLDNAQLSFRQKVELLGDDDRLMCVLKPGIRRLNTIRNRIAHKLRVDISAEDREALLGIEIFKAMRTKGAKYVDPRPDDPLSVVEQFAMFAANVLHAGCNPDGALWRQAAEMHEADAQQVVRDDGPASGGPAACGLA